MKKGLILSRKSELYSIQRFQVEASSLDLELVIKGPKDILESPPRAGDFDFVIPRFGTFMLEESIAALVLLEKLGVPTLNSSHDTSIVKDKWAFYQWCKSHNIPTPQSALSAEELSYPLVQKPRWGSKGEMVFLIQDRLQIQNLPTPTLFQEFIAEALGQDLRVLTLNQQIVGHYRRTAPTGDFRSNLAVGGTATATVLPSDIAEIAVKAAHGLSGLGLIGFDFLQSRRGPLLLEANASPGFTGIESLGGVNSSINMARLILKAALKL